MPISDFDDIQMPDDNNHSTRPHSNSIVYIIGVGGCGCNIVEYICKIGIPCNNVDFILIDHDSKFLNAKKSVDKKFIVDKDDTHLDGKPCFQMATLTRQAPNS